MSEKKQDKLVIVESPTKAKSINRILGEEFIVKSCMGHIRDLPEHELGVDIKNGFRMKFEIIPGSKKVISELKKTVGKVKIVYLAPDPDREGEAIAWHLREVLRTRDVEFKRVSYNEITPRAILEAFKFPRDIDMNKVESQQARRVLDRLVGYMVSRILWKRIQKNLSAGRVQTVALRLIWERENAIKEFKSRKYWIVNVRLNKAPDISVYAEIASIDGEKFELNSDDEVNILREVLQNREVIVKKIRDEVKERKPPPPHITSTLQQRCSSIYGFSPAKTMQIAQQLYEGVDIGEGNIGLITYMRTDSFHVAEEAIAQCREFIKEKFGDEYIPVHLHKHKSRPSAQEAHEAIRPTDISITPESMKDRLSQAQYLVYKEIWQRFVASFMSSLRERKVNVELECECYLPFVGKTGKLLFKSEASSVVFNGFTILYNQEDTHEEGDDKEEHEKEKMVNNIDTLLKLKEGETVYISEIFPQQKETRPPSRYTEGSLIREMERNGIGRPSTYSQIISTLYERRYVYKKDRTLFITELGSKVAEFLVKRMPELFEVGFTAEMEKSLDRIETGNLNRLEMLSDFYGKFQKLLEAVNSEGVNFDVVRVLMEHLAKFASRIENSNRLSLWEKKYLKSLLKQFNRKSNISVRQYAVLCSIISKIVEDIPELKLELEKLGKDLSDKLNDEEEIEKKFEIARKMTLDKGLLEFINSLEARYREGKKLTERQIMALDRIIAGNDNNSDTCEEDKWLLSKLEEITEWRKPVKKGRKNFDDYKFFESLKEYFNQKGRLTLVQHEALRKLAKRYGIEYRDSIDEGGSDGPEEENSC